MSLDPFTCLSADSLKEGKLWKRSKKKSYWWLTSGIFSVIHHFGSERETCCSAHWLLAIKLMGPSPPSSPQLFEPRLCYLSSSLVTHLSAGFVFHIRALLHWSRYTMISPMGCSQTFFSLTLYSCPLHLNLLLEKEKFDCFSRDSGRRVCVEFVSLCKAYGCWDVFPSRCLCPLFFIFI